MKAKAPDADTMNFKASPSAVAQPQPPVVDPDRLTTVVSKLPPYVKNLGKKPGEGRSDERVAHNLKTELARGVQSFINALNGLGWKHDARLEKDRIVPATAPAGIGAGSGGVSAAGK